MTSFVRRLAKSLSHDAGVRGPHDTRCPEPLSKMHSCPRQLPTSPSFNDFSLRTEEDAVSEFGPAFWTKTPAATTPMHRPTASSSSNSTFSESPVGSPTELTPSMVSALPKKTTRKIVGLDPYDFCDLLKSSSL